jgi:hypothetical protein
MSEDKRPQDITSVEKMKRVNTVKEYLLAGSSRSQIIQFCAKEYKVNDRASDGYIAEAKKIMVDDFHKTTDIDSFKAEIYGRLENLYQLNLEVEDFKACQTILKDIREMMGLNSVARLDVTTDGEKINQTPTIVFKKFDNERDSDKP